MFLGGLSRAGLPKNLLLHVELARVATAAGKAEDATRVADLYVKPRFGEGPLDPIKSWLLFTRFPGPLTPEEILAACDQTQGRLSVLIEQAESHEPPGGIPRETLNLVVLEGLRQLGLDDVEVGIDNNAG